MEGVPGSTLGVVGSRGGGGVGVVGSRECIARSKEGARNAPTRVQIPPFSCSFRQQIAE